MSVDLQIENEEVLKKIRDISKQLLPQASRIGFQKACALIKKEAMQNCPVDDGVLRASLSYKTSKDGGVVFTNVEYAPYVHEGTGIYAKDGNGRKTPWTYMGPDGTFHITSGQKPNPFLQDAADANMMKIALCFEGLLEKVNNGTERETGDS